MNALLSFVFKTAVLYFCLRLPFKLDSDVAGGMAATSKFLYNKGAKYGGALIGLAAYNKNKKLAQDEADRAGARFDAKYKKLGKTPEDVASREMTSDENQAILGERYESELENLKKSKEYKDTVGYTDRKKMEEDVLLKVHRDMRNEFAQRSIAKRNARKEAYIKNAVDKYKNSWVTKDEKNKIKGAGGKWLAWGASLATLPLGIEEAIKINLESIKNAAAKTSQKALLQGAQSSKWTDIAPLGFIAGRKPKELTDQDFKGLSDEQRKKKREQYKQELKEYEEKVANSSFLTGVTGWKPINRKYLQGDIGVMDYSSQILESDMKNYDDPTKVLLYWKQENIQATVLKNVKIMYKKATGEEMSDREAAEYMRKTLVDNFLVNDEGKPMWRDSVFTRGMSPWDAMLFKVGFEKLYQLSRVQSRYGGIGRALQRKTEVENLMDYILATGSPPPGPGAGYTGGREGSDYNGGWTPFGGPTDSGPSQPQAGGAGADTRGERPSEVKLDDNAIGLLKRIEDHTRSTRTSDSFDPQTSINHAIEQARVFDASSDQENALQMRGYDQTRQLQKTLSEMIADKGTPLEEAQQQAVELTNELEDSSPLELDTVAQKIKNDFPDSKIAQTLDNYINIQYAVEGARANQFSALQVERASQDLVIKMKEDPNLEGELVRAYTTIMDDVNAVRAVAPDELDSASKMIADHLPGLIRTTTGSGVPARATTKEAVQMARAVTNARGIINL